jgi:hypothetical protein
MDDDICTIPDCGRPKIARGWCIRHYSRWKNHGDPNYVPAPSRMRNGSKPTQFAAVDQRFGRWVVVDPEVRAPNGRRGALVRCSCPRGTERAVPLAYLFSGHSKSCGCLSGEMMSERNREANPALTHGLTSHPLFYTWQGILKRCDNPAFKDWQNYGGRGIQLYGAWHDPAAFVSWIEDNLGARPVGMSLDRIDNDGNYEPGNVRWATALQQRHNRRPERPCPCGNRNPVKANFCFNCGAALNEPGRRGLDRSGNNVYISECGQ